MSSRRRVWIKFLMEVGFAMVLALIGVGIAMYADRTFLTPYDPHVPFASVAALSPDPAAHDLITYLCVPPADGANLDGTILLRSSANSYLNLALPGSAGIRNSFLSPLFSPSTEAPACLDDPVARRVYEESITAQYAITTALLKCALNPGPGCPPTPTCTVSGGNFCFPGSPVNESQQAISDALRSGFRTIIEPTFYPAVTAENFQWSGGVQRSSWTERFIRLDFSQPDRTAKICDIPNDPTACHSVQLPVHYEPAVEVIVYLPAGSVPSNLPTSDVVSSGPGGISVVDIKVPGDDSTIQINWVDQNAVFGENLWLIVVGIALGVLGGLGGNLLFGPPRFESWAMRRFGGPGQSGES